MKKKTEKNNEFKIFAVCSDENYCHITGKWTKCVKCAVELFLSDSTVKGATDQGYFKKDISPICFSCLSKEKDVLSNGPLELSKEQIEQIEKGLPPDHKYLCEALIDQKRYIGMDPVGHACMNKAEHEMVDGKLLCEQCLQMMRFAPQRISFSPPPWGKSNQLQIFLKVMKSL